MSQLDNAYALIIGVDFEQHMPQVIQDAQDIYDALIDENICGYKKENVFLLLDDKAKTQDILDALDHLVKITNEDSSILFFYSGHGGYAAEYDISYLCPYDKDDMTFIRGTTLRKKLSAMKSKRKVVMLDCCHSGGFFQGKDKKLKSNKSTDSISTDDQKVKNVEGLAQEIEDDEGIAIITSCEREQESYTADGENSVFTKCFMEVLRGEHQTYYNEPFIKMVETINYMDRRIPDMSYEATGSKDKIQTPYLNLQMNNDFVISHLPKDKLKNIVVQRYSAPKPDVVKSEITSWRDEGHNLLLFIHGFSGESTDTFGEIPNFLKGNTDMDGWAIKPLGYSHHANPELGKDIWAAIYDIDRIARYLTTSISNKFKDYDRIAIVAHSLGGLVAQKAILDLDSEQQNRISHLILFGTPSNGIDANLLEKNWNKKYNELSSTGTFISDLRNSWNESFGTSLPFNLKVAAATNDDYVSLDSCFKGFDENLCEVISGKHLTMVKSDTKENDAYHLILNTLTDNDFSNIYTNKEEVNITLGKYDAVIKQLYPKLKENDLNEMKLKQLIFALEGLDRKEEAMTILKEQIDVVKNKSDFMGMLGGRYKRAFLASDSSKDSDAALDFYSQGLKLAEEADSQGQIYYHAINLAFLSIVVEGDEDQMMVYANQAIEAAEKSRKNFWQISTLAEANIYVGDYEKAMELYTTAAPMAGVREKISMHTNAYAGYCAVMQTDTPDDFIEFLKITLLT